jgi:hypothetical protein
VTASTKPVFQKLGLKTVHRAAILGMPSGVKLENSFRGEFDFVLGKRRKALTPSGMAWVCWRKGGVTDLSRETIRASGEAVGLESVAELSTSLPG